MSKNVALVAGAVGIVGKYVILELSDKPESDWEIFAISRRSIEYKSRAKHVAMDLLSPEELAKKLEATPDLKRVTHIFFAAYQEKPTQKELAVVNLAMLKNLVDAVEKVAPNLKHVSLIEGTKWYGVHLGAAKTPCLEDDPRYMTPNFYYDQEDYLIKKVSAGAKWSWSAMRPNPVCGVAFGNPMNLATGLAVYATFCKEQGLPFRFPGLAACWNILFEVVDAGLLARALIWAATTPQCANQAFNCSNGDVIRWSNIWEKIGKFFGLQVPNGPIMQVPLSDLMADNESAWAEIAKKHKLREIPYKDLASWPFVEWVMTRDYDWFCDVNKARRFGFHEMTMDSGDMFIRLFKEMQQEGIIPKY